MAKVTFTGNANVLIAALEIEGSAKCIQEECIPGLLEDHAALGDAFRIVKNIVISLAFSAKNATLYLSIGAWAWEYWNTIHISTFPTLGKLGEA